MKQKNVTARIIVACLPAILFITTGYLARDEALKPDPGTSRSPDLEIADNLDPDLPDPGSPPVNKSVAAAIAVNRITETPESITLDHPRYQAIFQEDGITFKPRRSSSSWQWRPADTGTPRALPTYKEGARPIIAYRRETITEQYLPRADSIEQRFILHQHPGGQGDLAVSGSIQSDGLFETYSNGWLWRGEDGRVVSLGQVTVFDAAGNRLPAQMEATPSSTTITVDGPALAMASFPVTIDPEIGTNDFQISATGDDFANRFEATQPDVAYNSTRDEYLVVWRADGTAGLKFDREYEIIGQRIDATTGSLLGTTSFIISTTFDDGIRNVATPTQPAVAYSPVADEYLVVWRGIRNEIIGQRLNGSDGSELGTDFQISDMGAGSNRFTAREPDVVYSATWAHYLVVWSGDNNVGDLVDEEYEIYGQLIDDTGAEKGGDDFRISDMGPDGENDFDAVFPAVAYNATNDMFLVVWEGDDDNGGLVDNKTEIFGQQLAGMTAAATGTDFRISMTGNNNDPNSDATGPAIAADPANNQFLVVWHANPNTPPLAFRETEIYGQYISGESGPPAGGGQFRISGFGDDDGTINDSANNAATTYIPALDQFLVTWLATEQLDDQGSRESEIFGQGIGAGSRILNGNNFRISSMGPDGSNSYGPLTRPTVTAATSGAAIVCWSSDDDRFGLINDEREIFGQQLQFVEQPELWEETGGDDFRISEAGNDGDNLTDAFVPAVAYNSTDNSYLVVWETSGTDDNSVNERLFANRIDATSGARLHPDDLQVTPNTGATNSRKENANPTAIYNPIENEFLIAWTGNQRQGDGFSSLEDEIFVRRMDGSTGIFPAGETRISDAGTRGSSLYNAAHPAVTLNPQNNRYLVVWEADSDLGSLVDDEFEIYGQFLDGSDASQVGADDFRISTTGTDGDSTRDATRPVVAYGDNFLVAWQADAEGTDDKFEIYSQRIETDNGQPLDPQSQVSQTGLPTDSNLDAENPSITANTDSGDFLIVWQADKTTDGNFQIYGEYILNGTLPTPDDFPVSDTPGSIATNPAAAYNPRLDEYVVAWESNPTAGTGGEEIHAQRLAPVTGIQIGDNDFLLSDMGPDGDNAFGARTPAVGVNTSDGTFFTAWSGDDDENGHIDDEFEIYGQLFRPDPTTFSITEILISGQDVIVRFTSENNAIYSLEESADLQTWTDASAGQLTGTGGTDQFTDTGGAGAPRRFYRVVRQP